MRCPCPNSSCSFFEKTDFVVGDGYYFRAEDSQKIKRFKCTHCRKKFSTETRKLEYRHKKRRCHFLLFNILCSGVSQRRSAKICRIDRRTVARKLIYFGLKARKENANFLKELAKNNENKVEHLQFDDLITFEHTKLKPLAVSVAVDAKRRFILGAEVAIIPSFGKLAKISKKRYGKRANEHRQKLRALFEKIAATVALQATVRSDEHKEYLPMVKRFFPSSDYRQYKGERATIAGFGELKKNARDPLFCINHTLALLRANINRLFRRTWCSTKSIARFIDHLDIFICYYNHYYLPKN